MPAVRAFYASFFLLLLTEHLDDIIVHADLLDQAKMTLDPPEVVLLINDEFPSFLIDGCLFAF